MKSALSGLVLVLISALLVLLIFLGMLFIRLAAQSVRFAHASLAQSRSTLAAASGMEYAAARLSQDSYPRYSDDPRDRGDDWTDRTQSPATGASLNPSYAHGEHWRDADGNGAFDTGIDTPYDDLDGDGKFSAWSGRLRSSSASRFAPLRFSLRITSSGGKIPVNAGFLDEEDRPATFDYIQQGFFANGVPDCRDLSILVHAGLAHVLNNLGAIVLPLSPRPTQKHFALDTSNPDEKIHYSFLGELLVANRPRGGYRSAAQVSEILLPAGYTPEDVENILPFLSLDDPPIRHLQNGAPWALSWSPDPQEMHLTHTPEAFVELGSAPPEVLEALWRYIGCLPLTQVGAYFDDDQEINAPFIPDPRTGPPPDGLEYIMSIYLLFPDEAARLARETLALRKELRGRVGWKALYLRILEKAVSMDPLTYPLTEPSDGGLFRHGFDPLLYPVALRRYAQAKAGLAFSCVCPEVNPVPYWGPLVWGSRGVPVDSGRLWDPGSGVLEPLLLPRAPPVLWEFTRAVHVPLDGSNYQGGLMDNPFSWPTHYGTRPMSPVRLSTFPPSAYTVESAGSSDRTLKRLRANRAGGESLFLTSQEDFENGEGGVELRTAGILEARNDAVWPGFYLDTRRRGQAQDVPDPGQPPRVYRSISSLPKWDHASIPASLPQPFFSQYYSRFMGALTLAPRQGGVQGAVLYWPFGERDADTSDLFWSEGGTSIEWLDWNGQPPNPVETFPSTTGYPATAMTPLFPSGGNESWLGGLLARSGGAIPEGLPGMGSGTDLTAYTIEGWCCRRFSGFSLKSYTAPYAPPPNEPPLSADIWFSATPVGLPNHPVPGVLFSLSASSPGAAPPGGWGFTQHFEPDRIESSGHFHFAVVIERVAPGDTQIRLYVNGAPGGTPISIPAFVTGEDERFTFQGLGDLRFHTSVLSQQAIRARYELGRFTRIGVYQSPLFLFAEPTTLETAQWTGVTPLSFWFSDGTGSNPPITSNPLPVRVEPFRVEVQGYLDSDGAQPAGPPIRLGDGIGEEDTDRIWDLTMLGLPGNLRAFRYTVTMDARDVAGPLHDTPVFEAITFTFRRKGRSGWTAWGAGK